MTTFAFLITVLGAGSVALNLLRLFQHLENPQPKRRTRAA